MTLTIPAETWVDLYSLTGVAVGRQIEVQNISASDIFLSDSATQPAKNTIDYRVATPRSFLINDNGDSGAWAFSAQTAGRLNVRLVV